MFLYILVLMTVLFGVYFFLVGLCFGSFALATAWRIKKKKTFGGKARSVCEHCKHSLAAKDLIPVFSWLWLKGKCRYCKISLSSRLPLAELFGGVVYASSYLFWPEPLSGWLHIARFFVWSMALILLLILFFYDIQWYILPNKVVHPLWVVSGLDFLLRFLQTPTPKTIIMGCASVLVGAGIFWLIYTLSKGAWIGYGDVRLGLAIGLLLGTPVLSALAIFVASIVGVVFALPGLLTRKRSLASRLPFGPLLIIGLIVARLFGQKVIDWYSAQLLIM